MGKKSKVRFLSKALLSSALLKKIRKLKQSYNFIDWLVEAYSDLNADISEVGKAIYSMTDSYRYVFIRKYMKQKNRSLKICL